ncbi:LytTR family DNA-binding domain-containing protein [Pseudophaeobacter flagellatus]|uniref:LytTR family DNA-binding domain-containing protein n=1 Tax=Pseudophaeobacter flagellatus TaxID=2899119 RepID=UPI001E52CE0A|nr:LytTR family DNA-binding domain-containing protein [Pseudophaeobacter flagellatus]MCD9148412.1 LytTR family transcriptional regulator [Pseudophaeobacter flagellatus]
MSLTMREQSRAVQLVALWLLITVFAAAVGPFGTFDVLALPGRLVYWAVIVGASIGLTRGLHQLLRGKSEPLRLMAQLPYALVLAVLVQGMNLLIFPNWGGWADFGFLFAATASLVLLVEIFVFLARHFLFQPTGNSATPAAEPAAELGFLRRLPLDKRAPLVRLEAQDHYLLVVTDRGQETLLMRLGDAEAELAETGLRVHRSHWVSRGRVLRHQRQKGRDFLHMADGTAVPISRSYKPAAQACGLM